MRVRGRVRRMEAVEVRVRSDRGWFGPFHREVVDSDAIDLAAIHEIRLLNDGTTVLLYEYRGTERAARRLAAEHLAVARGGWQTGSLGDAQLMYANAEPSPLVAGLLALLEEYRVVVDWPIEFRGDDELGVTLVGDRGEIKAACAAVPDGVRVAVARTGEYRTEPEGLLSRLTLREREVLAAAVELGYYRNPREAIYEDIAEAIGRSTGTVGEHLRNAETKVMRALLEDRLPRAVGPLEPA